MAKKPAKNSENRNKRGRKGEPKVGGKKPGPKGPHAGMWKPGQSGNPGGRPAGLQEVRDLYRQHTPEALEVLVDVMRNSRSDMMRMLAAQSIRDWGWGKAPQSVELTGKDGAPVQTQTTVEVVNREPPNPDRIALIVSILERAGALPAAGGTGTLGDAGGPATAEVQPAGPDAPAGGVPEPDGA